MDFNPERPIYLQIMDDLKKRIVRGNLGPGDKLPSQRELASTMGVNPNTVQRAYKELEDNHVTKTLRGQGTFVCESPTLVDNLRNELATRAIDEFITEMLALGLSNRDIKILLGQSLIERTE